MERKGREQSWGGLQWDFHLTGGERVKDRNRTKFPLILSAQARAPTQGLLQETSVGTVLSFTKFELSTHMTSSIQQPTSHQTLCCSQKYFRFTILLPFEGPKDKYWFLWLLEARILFTSAWDPDKQMSQVLPFLFSLLSSSKTRPPPQKKKSTSVPALLCRALVSWCKLLLGNRAW